MGLVFPIGTALVGLMLIAIGYVEHRRGQFLRDTPTSEVGSMAVGSVELTGTAIPAGETISAPVTDEEAVLVSYSVSERKRGADLEKEWKGVDKGIAAVPFYLDDGTGRVLVDVPDSALDKTATQNLQVDVSSDRSTKKQYEETDRQPSRLTSFLTEYTDADPNSPHERSYQQQIIPVDSDVFVFGDAELAERVDTAVESESNLVVTEDEDTEMFLVSDKSEDELTTSEYVFPVLASIGVLLVIVGLWWTLSSMGA